MKIFKILQNALQKYMMYKIDNGAYKFFVQKLEAEPDIDLVNNILSTDYFKHNLKPLPLKTDCMKKIIVFAPHQDDEVLGCGGVLSYLATQNINIHLVFLTDGENKSGVMKDIRYKETQCVSKKLNAITYDIDISNVYFDINLNHIKQVVNIIESINPDTIFVTWPLDAPPKHRLCSVFLSKVFSKIKSIDDISLINYQVHTTLIPNTYFDYTAYYRDKVELIKCYKSQLEDQNYEHLSMGLDAWNSRYLPVSKHKRYVELFTQLPVTEYIKMIDVYYPKSLKQTFKGNEVCIDAYKKLQSL